MPDDRSSGLQGGSGYIRFNGMDGSGIIPEIPDKKRSKNQSGQAEEDEKKETQVELKNSEYVDRSAQLRATLNSLAMLNVADVLKNKSDKEKLKNKDVKKDETSQNTK
jgi:hypothetical protein